MKKKDETRMTKNDRTTASICGVPLLPHLGLATFFLCLPSLRSAYSAEKKRHILAYVIGNVVAHKFKGKK